MCTVLLGAHSPLVNTEHNGTYRDGPVQATSIAISCVLNIWAHLVQTLGERIIYWPMCYRSPCTLALITITASFKQRDTPCGGLSWLCDLSRIHSRTQRRGIRKAEGCGRVLCPGAEHLLNLLVFLPGLGTAEEPRGPLHSRGWSLRKWPGLPRPCPGWASGPRALDTQGPGLSRKARAWRQRATRRQGCWVGQPWGRMAAPTWASRDEGLSPRFWDLPEEKKAANTQVTRDGISTDQVNRGPWCKEVSKEDKPVYLSR